MFSWRGSETRDWHIAASVSADWLGGDHAVLQISRVAGDSGGATRRPLAGPGRNRCSDRADLRLLQRSAGVPLRILRLLSVRLRVVWVLGTRVGCRRPIHRRRSLVSLLLRASGALPTLVRTWICV